MAFFEKRYEDQNLIVCNYLSKKVVVKLPIKPNFRTKIDSFLEDYLSVYDAIKASEDSFGTFFISLADQSITQIPNTYRDDYFFTGQGKDNK